MPGQKTTMTLEVSGIAKGGAMERVKKNFGFLCSRWCGRFLNETDGEKSLAPLL
jgi:hypothetical protein